MLPKLPIFKGLVLICWVLTLTACEPGGQRRVALQFVARMHGQDLDCGPENRRNVVVNNPAHADPGSTGGLPPQKQNGLYDPRAL